MALFYICYFAKMISQKKQGIDTDQLGKDKKGSEKFIEIALKVTTYVTPAVQLVSLFCYQGNSLKGFQIIGVVLTALGVGAFIVSVLQMKDNWRAGVQKKDKTNLVTEGIYGFSRNPAFLGFDLMYLGILITFFNVFLWIVTVVAIILFHLQITKVEEVFLREQFKEEYIDYCGKVCRYLGRKK